MTSTEFQENQFDAIYPAGVERHYWSKARTKIIQDFLTKQGLRNKQILEVGCGRGIVLRELLKSGFNCCGVELAKISTPGDLQNNLFSGKNFEDLNFEIRNSIEVVMLLDVVEHIEDDIAFIQKVQSAFPNLRNIVITVPARNEIWSNFDTYCGHYRRYNKHTLMALIERSDCKTQSISYFFHALFLPAWFFTVFKLQRATSMRVPGKYLSRAHSLLGFFFFLEYRFVPANIWGSSLIVSATVDE